MLTESQIEGYELANAQEKMLNVAAKQMMILILLPTIKFDFIVQRVVFQQPMKPPKLK